MRLEGQAHEIERGVAHLGHFFVPLFFVTVGAAVDVSVLNPLEPGNRPTLLIEGLLILAAVIGKFLAGYAPAWFKGNKKVIGVGMIPRGEVGKPRQNSLYEIGEIGRPYGIGASHYRGTFYLSGSETLPHNIAAWLLDEAAVYR